MLNISSLFSQSSGQSEVSSKGFTPASTALASSKNHKTKSTDYVSGFLNRSVNYIKGMGLFTAFQAITIGTIGGESLNTTLYNLFYNNKAFDNKALHTAEDPQLTNIQENFFRVARLMLGPPKGPEPLTLAKIVAKVLKKLQNGKTKPEEFYNPYKILRSSCPNKEFVHQLKLAGVYGSNPNLQKEDIVATQNDALVKCIGFADAFVTPVFAEIGYRGLVQDVILHKGVKRVVEFVAPEHADKVDSKAYTVARVLMTSLAFAYFNPQGSNYDTAMAFGSSLVLGALKETYGITASIGGGVIHRLVTFTPKMLATC